MLRIAVVVILLPLAGCLDAQPQVTEIHHYYDPPPSHPTMQPDGVIEWRTTGGDWGPAPVVKTESIHNYTTGPLPVPGPGPRSFEVRYTGSMTNLSLNWRTPAGQTFGDLASFDASRPGAHVISLAGQRDDGATFWLESTMRWEHTWTLTGTMPADSLTGAQRHDFYVPAGQAMIGVDARAAAASSGLGRTATLAIAWSPYEIMCSDGQMALGGDDTAHYLEAETWGSRIHLMYGGPPDECRSREIPSLESFDYKITVDAKPYPAWLWH